MDEICHVPKTVPKSSINSKSDSTHSHNAFTNTQNTETQSFCHLSYQEYAWLIIEVQWLSVNIKLHAQFWCQRDLCTQFGETWQSARCNCEVKGWRQSSMLSWNSCCTTEAGTYNALTWTRVILKTHKILGWVTTQLMIVWGQQCTHGWECLGNSPLSTTRCLQPP